METGATYTLAIPVPQRRASDRMPPRSTPDRFLALKEVKHMTSLSTATIYRKVGAGQFPTSIPIGSRVVWRESEIVGWMNKIDGRQ